MRLINEHVHPIAPTLLATLAGHAGLGACSWVFFMKICHPSLLVSSLPAGMPQHTESVVSEFFMPTDDYRLLQDSSSGAHAASLTLNLHSVMHRDLRELLWPGLPRHDCILFPEIAAAGPLNVRTPPAGAFTLRCRPCNQ